MEITKNAQIMKALKADKPKVQMTESQIKRQCNSGKILSCRKARPIDARLKALYDLKCFCKKSITKCSSCKKINQLMASQCTETAVVGEAGKMATVAFKAMKMG